MAHRSRVDLDLDLDLEDAPGDIARRAAREIEAKKHARKGRGRIRPLLKGAVHVDKKRKQKTEGEEAEKKKKEEKEEKEEEEEREEEKEEEEGDTKKTNEDGEGKRVLEVEEERTHTGDQKQTGGPSISMGLVPGYYGSDSD